MTKNENQGLSTSLDEVQSWAELALNLRGSFLFWGNMKRLESREAPILGGGSSFCVVKSEIEQVSVLLSSRPAIHVECCCCCCCVSLSVCMRGTIERIDRMALTDDSASR